MYRGVESSFFVGLRLRVKVGHRLWNLRDGDSVLSERCRQTNSQDFFKIIIIWDYYFKTGENRYGL